MGFNWLSWWKPQPPPTIQPKPFVRANLKFIDLEAGHLTEDITEGYWQVIGGFISHNKAGFTGLQVYDRPGLNYIFADSRDALQETNNYPLRLAGHTIIVYETVRFEATLGGGDTIQIMLQRLA